MNINSFKLANRMLDNMNVKTDYQLTFIYDLLEFNKLNISIQVLESINNKFSTFIMVYKTVSKDEVNLSIERIDISDKDWKTIEVTTVTDFWNSINEEFIGKTIQNVDLNTEINNLIKNPLISALSVSKSRHMLSKKIIHKDYVNTSGIIFDDNDILKEYEIDNEDFLIYYGKHKFKFICLDDNKEKSSLALTNIPLSIKSIIFNESTNSYSITYCLKELELSYINQYVNI